MVDEYRSVGLYLERSIQAGKLWPVPPEAPVDVSPEDRKLIASHLSEDAYGRASEAATNAYLSLRPLFDTVSARIDPDQAISEARYGVRADERRAAG